jgi:hypothetical protein
MIAPSDNVSKDKDAVIEPPEKLKNVEPDVIKYEFPVDPISLALKNNPVELDIEAVIR